MFKIKDLFNHSNRSGYSDINFSELFWKHTPFLLIFFLIIMAFNYFTMNNERPEKAIMIPIEKKATLKCIFEKDTVKQQLAIGDSVLYLGFDEAEVSNREPMQLWVQTADGRRGFVDIDEFNLPLINNKTREKITILGRSKDRFNFLVRTEEGREEELRLDDVVPEFNDDMHDYLIDFKGYYTMSEKKFRRLYLDNTFGKCDSLFRPAISVNTVDKQLTAMFNTILVFKKSDGRFYRPIVTFNDSLIATDYKLVFPRDRSDWLMKLLPFVSEIIDCDLFMTHIQESFYQPSTFGSYKSCIDGDAKWYHWIGMAFYILLGLVWLFAALAIPVLICEALLHCRYVFYPLGDSVLQILFAAVTIVSAYLWLVLTLAWGSFWIISIPMVFMAAFAAYAIASADLNTIPHNRCPKCRRLYTMDFDERVWGQEYEKWEVVSETGDLLHEEHGSRREWTHVTRSDGSSYDTNHRTIHTTDSTYAVHNYNVLYRYHPYDDVYKCHSCGHREAVHDFTKEELQREYLSSGTTTVHTES
ncbi:MAG: hypothetical protein IKO17_05520 [Prevotella sp.]|nr:hypothetical protein [Prevotella sp.]